MPTFEEESASRLALCMLHCLTFRLFVIFMLISGLMTNNQSLDIDFASLQRLQFLSLKVCASFPFFPNETEKIK